MINQLSNPQSYKTILFDAGYTLISASSPVTAICYRICREAGLNVTLEMIQNQEIAAQEFFHETTIPLQTFASEPANRKFWFEYYHTLLAPVVGLENETLLLEVIKRVMREFGKSASWKVYPDVEEVLSEIKKNNFILGVVSDWGMALAPIIRDLGLIDYFDFTVISAAVNYAKPDPSIYDVALRRANAVPDYTIHIGDSYIHDVLGARIAGITPILLDRQNRIDPEDVDCVVIHTLKDLLIILGI